MEEIKPFKAEVYSPDKISRNVLVIAPSGRGKSYAMRNLNPKTTLIVNTERKPLPFRNASEFKKHLVLDEKFPLDIFDIITYFEKSKRLEVLVIDSLSGWSTDLIEHIQDVDKIHGLQVYGKYGDHLQRLLSRLTKISSSSNKYVILITHEDIIENKEGDLIKSASVDGRRMKGKIERHFTVVLYGVAEFDEGENEFHFQTSSDGTTPAKSPADMFDGYLIDNDYAAIVEAMKEYWG